MLCLPGIAESLVVSLNLVNRGTDSLRDSCKQSFPSKVSDRVVGHLLVDFLRTDVGRGVVLRIIERQLQFQSVGIGPFPGFLDPRVETLWVTLVIEPCSFVETDRIDDQRVSIPLPSRMAVPGRAKILEVLT